MTLTAETTKQEQPKRKTCHLASVADLVKGSDLLGHVRSRSESDHCEKHGDFTRVDAKVRGEWILGQCPQCIFEEDSAKAKEAREETVRLAHQSAKLAAGIPKRFTGKTFGNYKTDKRGQEKAAELCRAYSSNFDTIKANGINMILCGKPGTGKTHLACAIGNILLHLGHHIMFTGAFRAIQTVKETYSNTSERTEQEAITLFVDLDLLILDEIGVQYGTDAEKLILFEIINRRYEDMKPTVLISNLQINDLSKYIGERVMDRMREGAGPVVAFDWDSARK